MKPKKHLDFKEGSREHVKSYDSQGIHCSEPDCEINKKKRKKRG